jgi:hypothetical protein
MVVDWQVEGRGWLPAVLLGALPEGGDWSGEEDERRRRLLVSRVRLPDGSVRH